MSQSIDEMPKCQSKRTLGSRTFVCEKLQHHPEEHRDGAWMWGDEPPDAAPTTWKSEVDKQVRIAAPESAPPATANDRQVGGDHYRALAIEHWDYVAANELDYFQGNITKYVTRWRAKGGVQDLEKAAHYLQKYIELVKEGTVQK